MRRPILLFLCAALAISLVPQSGGAHPEPPHAVIEEQFVDPGNPASARVVVRLDECQGCGTLVQSTGLRVKPIGAMCSGCAPGVMSSGVDLIANGFTLPLGWTGVQLVSAGPSGLTGPNLTTVCVVQCGIPWVDVEYGHGVGIQVWASGINMIIPICVSTIGANFGLCGFP